MPDPSTAPSGGSPNSPPPPWNPSGPTGAAKSVSFDSLAFLAKLIGLILLFAGALVIVVLVTPSAACVSAASGSCYLTWLQNSYNGLLAGRLLIVLGLGGLVVGAGIRLRYGLRDYTGPEGPELRKWTTARWSNTLMVLVALVLLIWLISTV